MDRGLVVEANHSTVWGWKCPGESRQIDFSRLPTSPKHTGVSHVPAIAFHLHAMLRLVENGDEMGGRHGYGAGSAEGDSEVGLLDERRYAAVLMRLDIKLETNRASSIAGVAVGQCEVPDDQTQLHGQLGESCECLEARSYRCRRCLNHLCRR